MTTIGTLTNGRMAQAYVDYMMGHNIVCQLSQNQQDEFDILLAQTEHLAFAQHQFQQFLLNPNDDKYLAASWQSANPQIKMTGQSGANKSLINDFISHGGTVTFSIFALCVVVYLTKIINVPQLYQALAFFNPLTADNLSQPWRLFTPALLHFSAIHIIFNLMWWWYLGGQIEQRISSFKLLTLFLLASSLPNLLQYFMTGPAFGGLSGVVYALLGYFWMFGKFKPIAGLQLPQSYIIFMLLWLVAGFMDLLGVPVANGAHLGGLLVGCGLGWLDAKARA